MQHEQIDKQMKKITAVLLIIGAYLSTSCKPVSISIDEGKHHSQLTDGVLRIMAPSKSGQFLAARQAQFYGDNAAAGFYFDQALPEGSSSLMLREQSFLSHYRNGNLTRAAAIAVELEQLGSRLSPASEPALSSAIISQDWQAVIALCDKIELADNGYVFASGLRSLAFIGLNEPETALQEQQLMLDFVNAAKIDIPREILTLQQAYLAEITGNVQKQFPFMKPST